MTASLVQTATRLREVLAKYAADDSDESGCLEELRPMLLDSIAGQLCPPFFPPCGRDIDGVRPNQLPTLLYQVPGYEVRM